MEAETTGRNMAALLASLPQTSQGMARIFSRPSNAYANKDNLRAWKNKTAWRKLQSRAFRQEFPGINLSPYQSLQLAQYLSGVSKREGSRLGRNVIANQTGTIGKVGISNKAIRRLNRYRSAYGNGLAEGGFGFGDEGIGSTGYYGEAMAYGGGDSPVVGGSSYKQKGIKYGLPTEYLSPYNAFVRELFIFLKSQLGRTSFTKEELKVLMSQVVGPAWSKSAAIQTAYRTAARDLKAQAQFIPPVDVSKVALRTGVEPTLSSDPIIKQAISLLR